MRDRPIFIDDRYVLGGLLGAGSYGAVYKAHDRWWARDVAIKILSRSSPDHILRFKHEFRLLRAIRHLNLVSMYAMGRIGDHWYLAMELMEGGSLAQPVVGTSGAASLLMDASTASGDEPWEPGAGAVDRRWAEQQPGDAPQLEPHEVYDLAVQILSGLDALHGHGLVHRDIKPSNILVDSSGIAKLADFGLTAEAMVPVGVLDDGAAGSRLVGTRRFMAPEQLQGHRATEASDIYSFGLVVGQLLTGTLPAAASGGEWDEVRSPVLREQARGWERALDERAVTSPALARLCRWALTEDVSARPSCRQALDLLGVSAAQGGIGGGAPIVPAAHRARAGAGQGLVVGRDEELGELTASWEAVKQGRAQTVAVIGEAGVGKSTLLAAFVGGGTVAEAPVAVGRSGEGEAIPYQGFDPLADALADHLCGLPVEVQQAVAPPYHRLLIELFPVLGRVPAWHQGSDGEGDVVEPASRREMAFSALRSLIQALASRAPMVIALDDLQWMDPDSQSLLRYLLAPPAPPALWLLFSRPSAGPGEVGGGGIPWLPAGLVGQVIQLGNLSRESSEELARRCLGECGEELDALSEAVARQSQGSPFLISLLSRPGALSSGAVTGGVTLGDPEEEAEEPPPDLLQRILMDHLSALPDEAVSCLQTLAVAGRAVSIPLLRRCLSLSPDALFESIEELCSRRLARLCVHERQELVECFHDRIRSELLVMMGSAARDRHLRLGEALEVEAPQAAPALMVHFREAGHIQKAMGYAQEAAQQSRAAQSFDREAYFYDCLLKMAPSKEARGPWRAEILERRAEALRDAGQGEAAGESYVEAAQCGRPERRRHLVIRAAEQFYVVGLFERGQAQIEPILQEAGIVLPRWSVTAAARLAMARLRLWLRGLHFKALPPDQIDQEQAERFEVLLACRLMFSFKLLHRLLFSSLGLLLALDLGDPVRLSRATMCELWFVVSWLKARELRGEIPIIELCRRLLAEHPTPVQQAHLAYCEGLVDMLLGRWDTGIRSFQEFQALSSRHDAADHLTRIEAAIFQSECLHRVGDVPGQRMVLSGALRDARERGLSGETFLVGMNHLRLLSEGKADQAQARLEEYLQRRRGEGQHASGMGYRLAADGMGGLLALYQRRGEAAWRHCQGLWRGARLLSAFGLPYFGLGFTQFRVQGLIVAALVVKDRPALRFRQVRRLVTRIQKKGIPWTDALAHSMLAALEACSGRRERALVLHEEAEARFEATGQPFYMAMERRRRGQTLGGEEGARLIAEGDELLLGMGVAEPGPTTDLFLPLVPGAVSDGWL